MLSGSRKTSTAAPSMVFAAAIEEWVTPASVSRTAQASSSSRSSTEDAQESSVPRASRRTGPCRLADAESDPAARAGHRVGGTPSAAPRRAPRTRPPGRRRPSTSSYQAALTSTSRTVRPKWWMPLIMRVRARCRAGCGPGPRMAVCLLPVPWPSANPMGEARRPTLGCRACRAATVRSFTPSLTSAGTRDRAPSCATCSSSPRTRQSSWTAM